MSQVHYQSLLPITFQVKKTQIKAGHPEDTIKLKTLSIRPEHSKHMAKLREETANVYRHEYVMKPNIDIKFPETKNQCLPDLNSPIEFPDLDTTHKKFPLIPTPLTMRPVRPIDVEKIKERKHPEVTSSSAKAIKNHEFQRQKKNSIMHTSAKNLSSNQKIESIRGSMKVEDQQFIYEAHGKVLSFQFVSDKRVTCPKCGNDFKNILNHIQKSKCQISQFDEFSTKFKEFIKNNMAEEKNAQQRKWNAKFIAKQREVDYQKVKDDQNRRKARSDAKQRENDNQKVKDNQNERKARSNAMQRESNNQRVKDNQNKIKARSDAKQRYNNNQGVKDDQNKRKARSDKKKREINNQGVKDDQNSRKAKSDAKQREHDSQGVKDYQNKRKSKSDANKRENDNQGVKDDQNKRKRLSRNKRKLNDPVALSNDEKEARKKKRRLWKAVDRLREFKEATKYNAIFICSCCHRRLFHHNVQIITQKLIDDINRKKFNQYENCVEMNVETPINGRNDCYICKTCVSHMKAKKMPPMSVKNNLKLESQDESLQLTELEGSLIAKNLIFLKIFQLPKSRWTALTDKIVNVPITNEDINNTLALLPRTPKEAGLIGVTLKRKLEYKNTHKKQLVDPKKIVKMLDLLKKSRNPYYQSYDDVSTFKERCKDQDPFSLLRIRWKKKWN